VSRDPCGMSGNFGGRGSVDGALQDRPGAMGPPPRPRGRLRWALIATAEASLGALPLRASLRSRRWLDDRVYVRALAWRVVAAVSPTQSLRLTPELAAENQHLVPPPVQRVRKHRVRSMGTLRRLSGETATAVLQRATWPDCLPPRRPLR
jgi:hypothetical protein